MVIVISLEVNCALKFFKKDRTVYFSIYSFEGVFVMIWDFPFQSLSF